MGGVCSGKSKTKDRNNVNSKKSNLNEQNGLQSNASNNHKNIINNLSPNTNNLPQQRENNFSNNLVVLSHRSRPQISNRDQNQNNITGVNRAENIPIPQINQDLNLNNFISSQPNYQTHTNDIRVNNIGGEIICSQQPENPNNSINEEFTSRRNQMSVTNQLNLYPSNNGVILRNIYDETNEQSQQCTLCNRSFWSNVEYREHFNWCTGARTRMVHSSLNEILNLVQTLNRQLHGEAPLNLLTLLGVEEPEDNMEYIDWNYTYSYDGSVVWKNCGKIKLTKEELNKITNKHIMKIKDEKYYAKRIWITNYINKNFYDKSGSNTTLVVSRENILEESFYQFMTTHELNLKRAMHIFFIDEVAHDVGGVYREWYTNLFDVIFSKEKGFFYEVDKNGPGKNTFFMKNNIPKDHKENYVEYYEFIGKILGKAIFDKITLKTNFNYVLLKHLLRFTISIEDIRYVDYDYYLTLKSLIENKLDDNSELYFTWNFRNENDQLEEIELIPNGKNIMISEENKLLFVLKVVDFVCYGSIKEKIDAMITGFYSVITHEIIKIFSIEEFDFLISGQNNIDLKDWMANTIYKGVYSDSHQTIKIFWNVLSNLTADKLLKFYKFCTGCMRVPIDGFNSLQGTRNKLQKFCIESPSVSDHISKKRLIEANTCFNRIYLPQYETEEEMIRVIGTIIDNDTNFFGKQ